MRSHSTTPLKLSPAQRVTHAIAQALARGVRPWMRPWREEQSSTPLSAPRRANGRSYRGVNVAALWAAAAENGFSSPYWLTFKQANALGGRIRKGAHGAYVVYYSDHSDRPRNAPELDSPSEEDAPARRRLLKGYVVFNRDQIEGLDGRFDLPSPGLNTPDAFAERFARIPASIRLGGSRAFYAPASDHIELPLKTAFLDETHFYATLAHELGHWTRHPSRLDRTFVARRFGDWGYALEELTAELCAAFLGAVIGLPAEHIEDHAAYIDSWLNVLNRDPSAFLAAAGKAQAAADYLLALMGEAPASAEPAG